VSHRSPTDADDRTFGAERAKAFIDAVVAIAMTLLILPLMESVGDAADRGGTAAHWFADHQQQLSSFAVSFVIIAMFWMQRHRADATVDRVTNGFLWLSIAWLLSIVWLPVATAMTGQMDGDDPVVKVVYIGSMTVTCLLNIAQRLYLRGRPALHSTPPELFRMGLAVDVSMAVLFAAALVIALAAPPIGYLALLIMFLTGPLASLLGRGGRSRREHQTP